MPLFVGKSTKGALEGEGIGTKQTFATFGAEHIRVESREGEFTRLIYHFSRYNNIRDIFQSVLLYRFGGKSFESRAKV